MTNKVLAAAIFLGLMGSTPSIAAELLGSNVDLFTSATGGTTVTPLGGPFASTVGAGPEYSACIGPNADNCVTSGLFTSIDLDDTSISFSFFGGTNPTTGTFSFLFNGFDPTITNVSYSSGSLGGGSFGLTSFDAGSMTFTGSITDGSFFTGTNPVVFNVTAATVPEPASAIPAALGILGLGLALYRKRLVSLK